MIHCGIYKITNQINKKCYIGQSINIEERWKHHKLYELKNSHYPLYQDFEKYGLDNFNFEIIEECTQKDLDTREIYWISYFNSYYNGYNQTKGGSASGHIVKLSNEDLEIIYDLLQNSDILQKDIAIMFNVGQDTISEINQGKTRQKDNYNYPLRNNKNKQHFYCIDCGKEITYGAIRCRECKGLIDRKVKQRPSRNELKQLIRTSAFLTIGKKFNVSDNTIRKWCITYNLPTKKSEIKQYSDKEWEKI